MDENQGKPDTSGSMKALLGGLSGLDSLEVIHSSESKNKYHVFAKKGGRKLALCCSFIVVGPTLGGVNVPSIAMRARLIEVYDPAAEPTVKGSLFGLSAKGTNAYHQKDTGMTVNFVRCEHVDMPILMSPASPSELYTTFSNLKIASVVATALKELVEKAQGELIVTMDILESLVSVQTNSLPTEPKVVFNPTQVRKWLKLEVADEPQAPLPPPVPGSNSIFGNTPGDASV